STRCPGAAVPRTCRRVESISTVRPSGVGTPPRGGARPGSWAGAGPPANPKSPITSTAAVTRHRLFIRLLPTFTRLRSGNARRSGEASNQVSPCQGNQVNHSGKSLRRTGEERSATRDLGDGLKRLDVDPGRTGRVLHVRPDTKRHRRGVPLR